MLVLLSGELLGINTNTIMNKQGYHKAAINHLLRDKKTFHISNTTLERNLLSAFKPLFYLVMILILPYYIFGEVNGFPWLVNMTTSITMDGFKEEYGIAQKVIQRKDSRNRTFCDVLLVISAPDNHLSAKHQSNEPKIVKDLGCSVNIGDKIHYIYNVNVNKGAIISPFSFPHLVGNLVCSLFIFAFFIWHILKIIFKIIDSRKFSINSGRYVPLKLTLQSHRYIASCGIYNDMSTESKELRERNNTNENIGKTGILKRIRDWQRLLNLKLLFATFGSISKGEYQAVSLAQCYDEHFMEFSFCGFKKVCYLYGIKESELKSIIGKRDAVPKKGRPVFPTEDRTIFFIGPWVYPFRAPPRYMLAVFSGDDARDYKLTKFRDKSSRC